MPGAMSPSSVALLLLLGQSDPAVQGARWPSSCIPPTNIHTPPGCVCLLTLVSGVNEGGRLTTMAVRLKVGVSAVLEWLNKPFEAQLALAGKPQFI